MSDDFHSLDDLLSEIDGLSPNDKTMPLDELFREAPKQSSVSDETKVIEDTSSHELFISMGQTEPTRRAYATEQYEPEDYGVSDESDLSFTGRGVRLAEATKTAGEEPQREAEYVSIDGRDEIASLLRRKRKAEIWRAVCGGLLTVALLWLGLFRSASLPLPDAISSARRLTLISLGLFAIVCGIHSLLLARAFRKLFTAKYDADCLLPFAFLASLALLLYDLFVPSAEAFPLLAASVSLALTVNAFARAVRIKAVRRSFALVGSNTPKRVLVPVRDEKKSRDIMNKMLSDGTVVYKPESVGFVTGFLRQTSSAGIGARTACVLAYLSPFFAAAVVALTLVRGGDVRQAVYAGACMLCAFLPLSAQLAVCVPYARAVKSTAKMSSTVLGYRAAEEVTKIGAAVIDSSHLFPDGSLSLDAMRTFSANRIDDAIIDAASVMCAAGGALSRIFLGVIDNDRSLLRHVDNLLYEDGLGLSAWVNERRVLVGTAELIRGHGIDVPSRDYEARYSSPGQNLVYVSVGGKLTAMFVITYHPRQEIYDTLFELRREHIGLVIINRDCNITASLIEHLFDFPTKLIEVMTPSNEPLLGESREESCEAGLLYSKGLLGIGRTILSSLRMVRTASLANAVQTGGIFLTAALVMFLSVVGSLADLTLTELLICQIVFGLLTLSAALFRKI